jgi:hypothetical protein
MPAFERDVDRTWARWYVGREAPTGGERRERAEGAGRIDADAAAYSE